MARSTANKFFRGTNNDDLERLKTQKVGFSDFFAI